MTDQAKPMTPRLRVAKYDPIELAIAKKKARMKDNPKYNPDWKRSV